MHGPVTTSGPLGLAPGVGRRFGIEPMLTMLMLVIPATFSRSAAVQRLADQLPIWRVVVGNENCIGHCLVDEGARVWPLKGSDRGSRSTMCADRGRRQKTRSRLLRTRVKVPQKWRDRMVVGSIRSSEVRSKAPDRRVLVQSVYYRARRRCGAATGISRQQSASHPLA